jgi:hypothetical protein
LPGFFSGCLLKEYHNRWFVLGVLHHRNKPLLNLALDRIKTFTEHDEDYIENTASDFSNYYNDVIRETKSPGQRDVVIVFWIKAQHAPYVVTKPLHHT